MLKYAHFLTNSFMTMTNNSPLTHPNPSTQTASRKQQAILRTAVALFNEHGFVNVGVDKIVSESDIAKMTFYKYFPSKDNLIAQTLRERDSQIRESMTQAFAEQGHSLKTIFDWYKNWFEQDDFFGCLFIKASDEFSTHPTLTAITLDHKNWLTEQISDCLSQENIKTAQALAVQIRLILDGAIVNKKVFPNQDIIGQAWQIAQILLKTAEK